MRRRHGPTGHHPLRHSHRTDGHARSDSRHGHGLRSPRMNSCGHGATTRRRTGDRTGDSTGHRSPDRRRLKRRNFPRPPESATGMRILRRTARCARGTCHTSRRHRTGRWIQTSRKRTFSTGSGDVRFGLSEDSSRQPPHRKKGGHPYRHFHTGNFHGNDPNGHFLSCTVSRNGAPQGTSTFCR